MSIQNCQFHASYENPSPENLPKLPAKLSKPRCLCCKSFFAADLDIFGSSQIFFDEKSMFACTQRQKHGNAFLMS